MRECKYVCCCGSAEVTRSRGVGKIFETIGSGIVLFPRNNDRVSLRAEEKAAAVKLIDELMAKLLRRTNNFLFGRFCKMMRCLSPSDPVTYRVRIWARKLKRCF